MLLISSGKWKLASKAAVVTVNGSVGGGLWAISYCYLLTNKFQRKLSVTELANGILAGLVSVTGICAICQPWEALIIGCIGGMISSYGKTICFSNCRIKRIKAEKIKIHTLFI